MTAAPADPAACNTRGIRCACPIRTDEGADHEGLAGWTCAVLLADVGVTTTDFDGDHLSMSAVCTPNLQLVSRDPHRLEAALPG